ncbi:MAG: hypothetical protein RLZZ93_781 [Actinomycetota bacterium]
MKSASQACTSVGMWGTDWHPSTMATAPARWAAATRSATGLMVPSTFDMAVKENAFAPSSRRSRPEVSSSPSAVSGTQRISNPFSAASICQGTMLAWCSMWVSTTASPARRLAPPQLRATRLSASVAFFVNTISLTDRAFTKRATLARADSKRSVASAARWYALRLVGP